MNSNVKFIFGVLVGAAIGVLGTKRYFAKKESKRADEEIASIQERFTVPREESEEKKEYIPEEKATDKTEAIVPKVRRHTYATSEEAEAAMRSYRGEPVRDESRPFLISPDEFEENEPEHENLILIYYADGIVTDDNGCVLDYPEDILGPSFEEWFGEYEPDSIHVRNKEKGVDYEVLKDMRKFKDVLNDRPRSVSIK